VSYDVNIESPMDYHWNGFWCIFLTITTIGYGDFYPVTTIGRLVVTFVVILGANIMTI